MHEHILQPQVNLRSRERRCGHVKWQAPRHGLTTASQVRRRRRSVERLGATFSGGRLPARSARAGRVADTRLCFAKALFPRVRTGPEAAACKIRRKLGHSITFGARHVAACNRPSRISVRLRIVLSNSAALDKSLCRSIRGCPLGVNTSAISLSVKPAARPNAIRASRSKTSESNVRCKPRLPIEEIKPFSS